MNIGYHRLTAYISPFIGFQRVIGLEGRHIFPADTDLVPI